MKPLYLGHGVLLWIGLVVLWQFGSYLYATREQVVHREIAAQQRLMRQTSSISCTSCHKTGSRTHLVGPHLVGIIGRRAGALDDFAYTTAMKNSRLVWSREQLRGFLLDPQKVVPGTAMPVAVTAGEVDAVLDYLEATR